ncbi:formyl transferase [Geopyxis carbonaria]|nr:formyl transferase [Geopyxis carbonaria]
MFRRRVLHGARYYSSSKQVPLRILFAGSDDFSSTSLRALHQEYLKKDSSIESIDLLCKEDGRTGRRLDVMKEVPIKAVARSLEIPVHTIPGFKNFTLPDTSSGQKINLLVAVSFGLFIPAAVINAIEFGGLNVHPSLLPMYRGAAPIHHTILNQTPIAGVSIQTLDVEKFDHGKILMQSDPPIAVHEDTTFGALKEQLANLGAEMLVKTIRQRLFVPPLTVVHNEYQPSMARKLSSSDKMIDWHNWTAKDIQRRSDVFGTLWSKLGDDRMTDYTAHRRALLKDIKILKQDPRLGPMEPGCFRYIKPKAQKSIMAVRCLDGWVTVGSIQLDGKKQIKAAEWAMGLQGRGRGKIFYDSISFRRVYFQR